MYTNTKEVIDQIARYHASLFTDNNLMDQILSNYSNFDSDNKKEVEQYMYEVYRGKFDSLFLSNNYVESIDWMNKVIEHEGFKKERPYNLDHFLIKAVNSLLIVYFEKKDRNLLARAKKYFNETNEARNSRFFRNFL